jgi:hypothetical protein
LSSANCAWSGADCHQRFELSLMPVVIVNRE